MSVGSLVKGKKRWAAAMLGADLVRRYLDIINGHLRWEKRRKECEITCALGSFVRASDVGWLPKVWSSLTKPLLGELGPPQPCLHAHAPSNILQYLTCFALNCVTK